MLTSHEDPTAVAALVCFILSLLTTCYCERLAEKSRFRTAVGAADQLRIKGYRIAVIIFAVFLILTIIDIVLKTTVNSVKSSYIILYIFTTSACCFEDLLLIILLARCIEEVKQCGGTGEQGRLTKVHNVAWWLLCVLQGVSLIFFIYWTVDILADVGYYSVGSLGTGIPKIIYSVFALLMAVSFVVFAVEAWISNSVPLVRFNNTSEYTRTDIMIALKAVRTEYFNSESASSHIRNLLVS